ncbi:YopX family protein [Enterococcus casseliflavus]|uniref:YopX family protein n=1 Tax=Enterococcus casseliflavus TaxID=37734 RepID=UPI0039A6B5E4
MVPKFRGKTIKGLLVVGYVSVVTDKRAGVEPGTYISNSVGFPFAYEVDPKTVGQSTGLKDKNGAEIYCGDAVEWLGHRGIVEFVLNNQQTMIIGASGYITDLDYSTDFNTEVIGNIHENPKILGQTNEI